MFKVFDISKAEYVINKSDYYYHLRTHSYPIEIFRDESCILQRLMEYYPNRVKSKDDLVKFDIQEIKEIPIYTATHPHNNTLIDRVFRHTKDYYKITQKPLIDSNIVSYSKWLTSNILYDFHRNGINLTDGIIFNEYSLSLDYLIRKHPNRVDAYFVYGVLPLGVCVKHIRRVNV